jgi:GAF domain-containing protein
MLAASDFADLIADAARTFNQAQTLDETFRVIVEAAPTCVPGFEQVSIATMAKQDKPRTRAFVGEVAARLDAIQYDLHEGPCSAALQGSDAVAASSLRQERRWARYVPRARGEGVRSQLSVRLDLDRGALGGINFYSTVSDHVSTEAQALARLFAVHAAIALEQAHERVTLKEALQSRQVIGQAIGILMERYQMNEEGAFAFLVRMSTHANIKLRAIAQRLVDERNGRVVVEDRDGEDVGTAAARRSGALLREESTHTRLAAHEAQVTAEAVRSRSVKKARSSRTRFEQALVRLDTAQSELELTERGQAVGNQ